MANKPKAIDVLRKTRPAGPIHKDAQGFMISPAVNLTIQDWATVLDALKLAAVMDHPRFDPLDHLDDDALFADGWHTEAFAALYGEDDHE